MLTLYLFGVEDNTLMLPSDEDDVLLRCLRARKYNIEKSLKLVNTQSVVYYTN